VVVGDTLRNLVSRAGMHFADTSQLANLFPTQLCLARGPALQGGIYLARQWACRMAETRRLLLKIDVCNAYNSVERQACVEGFRDLCPDLHSWAAWTLAQPTPVLWGPETLLAAQGVAQGEPMSAALFCAGIQGAIDAVTQTAGLSLQFFADDGLLCADLATLNVALPRLEHELSLRGLRLNLGKCELYAPTEVQLHPEIPTVTNPEMMDYLGVPLLPGKSRLFQTTEMKSGALTSRIRDLALQWPA